MNLSWGDVIGLATLVSTFANAFLTLKVKADIADVKVWAIDRFQEKRDNVKTFVKRHR
jgi:hypothetical protein